MYLAYPPPDDEELAACAEAVRSYLRQRIELAPGSFVLAQRKHIVRPMRRRTGSDNPLRLAPARETRRRALPRRVPAVQAEPETVLREAVARARQRGWTMEALAAYAGLSEKTLRRHLSAPETIPLGEYRRLMQAAGRNAKGG